MTHDEMIAVIAAHRDGYKIQQSRPGYNHGEWIDCIGEVGWSFETHSYRIKPAPPKPREWWIIFHNDGQGEAVMTRPSHCPGKADGCGCPEVHVIEVLPSSGESGI